MPILNVNKTRRINSRRGLAKAQAKLPYTFFWFARTDSKVNFVSPSYMLNRCAASPASDRISSSILLERGVKRALNGSGRMFSLSLYAKALN